MFSVIFLALVLYCAVFIAVSEYCSTNSSFCFNPKGNYKKWDRLNWFGVWFFTILYWIAFLPFAIIALIYWLFTVGREE